VTNRSLAQPAPPPPATTRELRGLDLYRSRGAEIEHIGHGVYRVPACGGGVYEVNLKVFADEPESCNCPDYQRHKQTCKHVYAATVARAKARMRARTVQAERTKARASRASLAPLAAAL
jgi:hypothetical protein